MSSLMGSHGLFFCLFTSSDELTIRSASYRPLWACQHRRTESLPPCTPTVRALRPRDKKLAPRSSLSVRANCLNVWLLPWNMSEKLIMWLHSESRYELWMNFSPLDQRTVVYRAGGSSGCLSIATRASPLCHNCAASASKFNQRRW